MKNPNIVFVGLDTHKESTHVAYVFDGFDCKLEYHGNVASRKQVMVTARTHQDHDLHGHAERDST